MPRRPITLALRLFHIGFALFFVGLLVVGIVRSLLREAEGQRLPPGACGQQAPADCLRELRGLRDELEAEVAQVERTAGTAAASEWDGWSVGWRERHRSLQARCCLGPDRKGEGGPLGRADRELSELERLYAVHVVQFAHEVGPAVEALGRDLSGH